MALFKKKETPVTRHHLLELANVWLTPQAVKCRTAGTAEQLQKLKSVAWEHEDCGRFWEKYILPYSNSLNQSGLLPTIQSVLQILDESGDHPSVDVDDPETPEQYRVLTGITLREHSIHVAEKTINFLSKNHPEFQRLVGEIILATLAHDIGVMCKPMAMASHSVNGAKWCQTKLSSKRNAGNIVDAVRFHHAEQKQWPKSNPILPSLVRFNEAVRAVELTNYEEENAADEIRQTVQAENQQISPLEVPEASAPETPPAAESTPEADDCSNPFGNSDESPGATAPTQEETDLPEAAPATGAEENPFSDPADGEAIPAEVETPPASQPKEAQQMEEKAPAGKVEKKEKWLTGSYLYNSLVAKVSPIGFDAFVFEDKAYFKPKVIRDVLLQMAEDNGDQDFTHLMGDIIDHLIAGFGFANNQAKLKFAGKTPPHKAYYFIIDKDRLPLPDDFEDLAPREVPDFQGLERNGKEPKTRYLKKVIIMER